MTEIPDDIMRTARAAIAGVKCFPPSDFDAAHLSIAQAIFSERQRHAEVMEEVRKVLEPFAEAANSYDPDENDNHQVAWAHDFQIGSLRAALALLSRLEER